MPTRLHTYTLDQKDWPDAKTSLDEAKDITLGRRFQRDPEQRRRPRA
jgi:hypothetical protein